MVQPLETAWLYVTKLKIYILLRVIVYGISNTVNRIVITLYGNRWLLDIVVIIS